jgi:amino acid transporter
VASTVELLFRYAERDYVRAMRAHYARRLRPRLDITLAVILAIIGVYFWRSPESRWEALVCFGLSGTLVAILIAAFGVIPHVVFRREMKFRDEYSLTFSPDGIRFRTAHIDSQLQWTLYSWALVTADSYILYYGVGSFTLVPKRVFQNAEQQSVFEGLLSQNIARIVRKI